MVETGWFYGSAIDPILKSMRKKLAAHISANETVIDIACGTGAQVFEMAGKAKRIVGVDLADSMIEYAKKQKLMRNTTNTEFVVADATDLCLFSENEFDVATMSLALHQFSPILYKPILDEMKRVAKRIVIVDYAVPLPSNYIGVSSKIIEFMAGREHNRNFRKFYKSGGLTSILPQSGLQITKEQLFAKGAFLLVVCSKAQPD
ncbi:class I SAM-dependent methyltransferase [uncultured Draconibacterium sp.]|uniref:class I SAM-dependent methyltransferase n=1 Tax=uncultured Draconibacterium sp. TaxID=1573823 RepID=UPI003217FE4A